MAERELKLYIAKAPNGELVANATPTANQNDAWQNGSKAGIDGRSGPEYNSSNDWAGRCYRACGGGTSWGWQIAKEVGEAMGYTLVEVEFAEKKTASASKLDKALAQKVAAALEKIEEELIRKRSAKKTVKLVAEIGELLFF